MAKPANGTRARAFQALRDSEELHRVVLFNMSDAVFLTDDEGRFVFICPNVDVLFGYSPDEVQAMSRINFLLGEKLYDAARLAADGEMRNLERDVTTKSGERRVILVHVKRVAIKGGTILWACRDVTDWKAAEERVHAAGVELARASRLALVGELIASIVQEITQPLTSASANAGAGLHLLEGEQDADAIREILDDIRTQTHMAAGIVGRLKALARRQPFEMEVLDVNEVVAELLGVVAGEARLRRITLRSDLGGTALRVVADRAFLREIVLNLVVNAMEALEQVEDERLVTLRTSEREGHIEIAVSDTGPGVPAELAARLFDPFVTTKKEGVGLGLAIARSLVEAQGGRLAASGHGEPGATFRVTLPAGTGSGLLAT
jgi:PAS domain S-box-containing protein